MRNYFCGWYFKAQSGDRTLAVIAAYHSADNNPTCSLQFITDTGAWNVVFPYNKFNKSKDGFHVSIGNSTFSTSGITLDVHEEGIDVSGNLVYGLWTPIKYDIMGPFRFVPFMECRHSVISMYHTVNGKILLNGEEFVFNNSSGYIEGDRGYSFPKVYSWTQCIFEGGSLMLSIADIPFGPFRFTGIIGVVYLGGKEYRIATYLGAKQEKIENGEIIVKQGKMKFTAKLIEKHALPLKAPTRGEMSRIIRESASCRASYKLEIAGETLLCFESDKASFEYEYPN